MAKRPFDVYVRPREGILRRWRYADSFTTLDAAISAAKRVEKCEYQIRQTWAAGSTL